MQLKESRTGTAEETNEVREEHLDFYKPLIGSRHIDPYNGLMYETIEVKETKQRNIVAWRRRVLNGILQGKLQGPFHVHDIHKYTNQHLIECAKNITKGRRAPASAPSTVSSRQETSCPASTSNKTSEIVGTSYPKLSTSHLNGKDPLANTVKRTLTSTDAEDISERGSDLHKQKKPRHTKTLSKDNSDICELSVRKSPRFNKRYCVATHLAASYAMDDMFTFMSLIHLYNTYCFNTINVSPQVSQQEDFEPPTRKLMLQCLRKPRWEEAEQSELKSIQECQVWTKEPQPPEGVKPLPLKWVYKVKKDLHGVIQRFKARLVVQGFFQVFGFDYTETYKFTSIRLLLAIAVQLGLYIHQMDVDTAFLNAPIDEHIWVMVPDGTSLPPDDNGIYKLLKSLYGLKQAPRCWNNMINQYLIAEGFERLEADTCLYVLKLTKSLRKGLLELNL